METPLGHSARGEDDPDEPKAGESEEEAPLAPQQEEEEENVDWGSPPASESDVQEERETGVVTVSHSEASVPPRPHKALRRHPG